MMSSSVVTQFDHMVVTLNENGVRTLRLNRPRKKNALLATMMTDLISALQEAANCEYTKIMVITGTSSTRTFYKISNVYSLGKVMRNF